VWPSRLFAPVTVAWLAACGSGKPPVVANNAAEDAAASVGASLAREVGAGVPVAIVPGAKGLRAVSADGKREKLLAPGPVPWALVDNRGGVVWFGNPDSTEVRAIELAAPGSAPSVVTVVADLPPGDDGPLLVAIHYPGSKPGGDDELTFGAALRPRAVVVVTAQPSIDSAPGILEEWGKTDDFKAQLAQVVLRDRALVARAAARGAGKRLALVAPAAPETRVAGIDATDCADSPGECGRAQPIANTALWRVVVGYICGDGCYSSYRIYDPEAKRLRDGDWNMLGDAWVAADGSAFVTDSGVVVRFDTGPLATTPRGEWSGGGWLGGGYFYE